MEDGPKLSLIEKLRTRAYLFGIGVWRHVTFGVRGMLVDGTQVYLIRHTYLPGWQLPGGGVEPGETAHVAMAREVEEETGYRLTAPGILFGLYLNDGQTNRDHVALYVCRDFEKVRDVKANAEIAAFGWWDIADLPGDVTGATRRRIKEVFEGLPADDRW